MNSRKEIILLNGDVSAREWEEVAEQVTAWKKTMKEYGLKLNVNETEIMCTAQENKEI